MGKLIQDCRERFNLTNWAEFAALLSHETDLVVTQDALDDLVKGRYKTEPDIRVTYALLQLEEFRFRGDQAARITMAAIANILYSRCDIYGRPIQIEHN